MPHHQANCTTEDSSNPNELNRFLLFLRSEHRQQICRNCSTTHLLIVTTPSQPSTPTHSTITPVFPKNRSQVSEIFFKLQVPVNHLTLSPTHTQWNSFRDGAVASTL